MKVASVVLATFAALIVLAVLFVERIPPRALTRTRMVGTEQRIRNYYASHGRLPTSLSDLPELEPNRDGELTDGWGRLIQYEVNDHTVTLLSLGEDGRIGGPGDDEDMQITFTVAD